MIRPTVCALLFALGAFAQTSTSIGPYTYDGAGNIASIGSDTFTYDEFGRVRSASVAGQNQQFTYDRFGNLRTIQTGTTTIRLGADAASNRLSANAESVSGQPANAWATYDAAGQLKQWNSTGGSFEYDAIGMITSSRGVPGDSDKIYLYTPNDERIATVTLANGSTEWTLRDASGKVLRRLEQSKNEWRWQQDYIYLNGQLLASEVDGSHKTLHYFLDHLGTPRVITNNGGVRIATHTYLPFGAEATSTNQDAERKKFTGHERDASGLDYMHARYYSAGVGRFLTVDPGRDWDPRKPQAWNMYSYVRNNPINTIDPTGKWGWSDFKQWVRDTRDDLTNWWHEKWHENIPPPADQYGGVEALKAADLSSADAQQIGNPQANWANARAEAGAIVSDEATTEAMSWGVGKVAGAAVAVVFSRQAVGHGARHLAGSGLSSEVVEGAIEREVQFVAREASQTGSFWGRITVEGRTIQFKAHTLPDGRINVGTYWELGD
ncbi:MAG: RHS repeat-associated core domain-containing protein [Thermoanaerobaculia bacterium]